tara:strand:- start:441 stop:620 length:180 start_codon:yes stop_codon:yes gene_type:complete
MQMRRTHTQIYPCGCVTYGAMIRDVPVENVPAVSQRTSINYILKPFVKSQTRLFAAMEK